MKSKAFDRAGRRDFLLVLDGGDDVTKALVAFAKQNAIAGASLQGIGAFARATIAYWNPQTKEYEEIAVNVRAMKTVLFGASSAVNVIGRPRRRSHSGETQCYRQHRRARACAE